MIAALSHGRCAVKAWKKVIGLNGVLLVRRVGESFVMLETQVAVVILPNWYRLQLSQFRNEFIAVGWLSRQGSQFASIPSLSVSIGFSSAN